MIRGLFFIVGLIALIQGALCVGIESLTLSELAADRLDRWLTSDRVLSVPIWFGPGLVFLGGVTLLYAIALPARRVHHRERH